ncbi:MAG: lysozyme [Pseudomonadota bacterium]
MQISDEGVSLIKRFEGLKLEAYQDIADIWTIGYGHTGSDVFPGQVISEAEAERLLRKDVERFERGVESAVKVDIVQAQFDALVSFSFNVGVGALKKSTALKRLNKGDYEGAAEALTWWNKARVNGELQVVSGLARRRAAEAALFLRDLDQIAGADAASEPELTGVEVVENSPRRSNPVTTRTTGGAATAGAAGAAGAGAVILDDEDGSGAADDDAPETPTEEPDASNPPSENDPETAEGETETITEVPANDIEDPSQQDITDAVIVAAGVLAVVAAIYVIGARVDDWRKYRR